MDRAETCIWVRSEETNFATSCKMYLSFEDDPEECEINYCSKCGGKVEIIDSGEVQEKLEVLKIAEIALPEIKLAYDQPIPRKPVDLAGGKRYS